jgi:DNA repair exonuclease SbcCD ATPase subunit
MTLTDKELHNLLTEARRDAGNEAVRLKVQLAEEVESHQKTAKELQETESRLSRLDKDAYELRFENEGYRQAAKHDEEVKARLQKEIEDLKRDLQIEKTAHAATCKEKNARIAELENERDRWKDAALETEDKRSQLAKQIQDEGRSLRNALEYAKAENASLRAHAGYWRALKGKWLEGAEWIRFNCSKWARIQTDQESYEGRFENIVSQATGYKPEATNEG